MTSLLYLLIHFFLIFFSMMTQNNGSISNSNASLINTEEMLGLLCGMMEAQQQTQMMHIGMMVTMEQINAPRPQ